MLILPRRSYAAYTRRVKTIIDIDLKQLLTVLKTVR